MGACIFGFGDGRVVVCVLWCFRCVIVRLFGLEW